MGRFTSIAVSLIIAVVSGGIIGNDVQMLQPEAEQVRPIAVVRRFQPTVELASLEKGKYYLSLEENLGERLYSGDTLNTDKEGYALVIFNDNTIAKVKPESTLIVSGEERSNTKDTNRRINLDKGQIKLEVEPQGSGSFEVATSRSVASVKGTEFGATSYGYVWVREGQVDVTATNSGETVSLFQQMFAQVDESGNNIDTGTLTQNQIDDLEEGYDELDEDLIERKLYIRFRDANGQIRTIETTIFEKGN